MRRQAEELFYCFNGKFSPRGFAESVIPCEVKEGWKSPYAPVMGRDGQHQAKGALWAQLNKSMRACSRGFKADRGRVIQDVVIGEKMALKSR